MMKCAKEYSPFYKIRKTLVLLRWTLGFPLQEKDNSYTEFRFVLWLECLRFPLVCLMPLLGLLFWILVLLIVDGNLENLEILIKESSENYSTSKIDHVLTHQVWPISGAAISLSYIFLFKNNTHCINSFSNEVKVIKSKIASMLINIGEERKQTHCITIEKSEKLIIYGQIFNLITSFLSGLWYYNLCMTLPKDHIFYRFGFNFQLVLPPIIAIQLFFVLFGPISCAVELLICQMINSLSDLFKDWKTILQSNLRLNTGGPPQQVNNRTSSDDLETGDV